MNHNGIDEAKAARIQKYKEERRKQLTARTAVALSNNVTERRPSKKLTDRTASADSAAHLKSTSDLNLNSSSSSVSIRTTRASRLRAAASSTAETFASSKNNLKTASTVSLEEHGAKTRNRRSIDKNRSLDKKIKRNPKIEDSPNSEDSIKSKEDSDSVVVADICVQKVERFSELLNNLGSTGNEEQLFEDLLAETGDGCHLDFSRILDSSRTAPCRRASREHVAAHAQAASTPKRPARDLPHENEGINGSSTPIGTAAKTRHRRSLELPTTKTEISLPPSRISPKCSSVTSTQLKKELPVQLIREPKSPSSSPPSINGSGKTYRRRRSSDISSKPSCIPLSKKSIEKDRNPSRSPTKSEHNNKEPTSRIPENRLKRDTNEEFNTVKTYNSNAKVKNDSENRIDKTKRLQKNNEPITEKYQYSKKRLTSLDNSKDSNEVRKTSPKGILNGNMHAEVNSKNSNVADLKVDEMSTLHEFSHSRVRPHINNSRLSQRLDSLEALTKKTLDRVNKLSNNDRAESVVVDRNNIKIDTSDASFDALFASTSNIISNGTIPISKQPKDRPFTRGVTERLKDIDTAAQRLIDFERQSAINSFCDLKNDTSSQIRRNDSTSTAMISHTPVSILKRKSIQEDSGAYYPPAHVISSPPVTFSPSVIDPLPSRSDNRQKQGILKKRRSLDESQVSRRRSCSPEVSFADDGSPDINKPILKNRRSSLEDVVRNHSPDVHQGTGIQGILKRKMSREEELHFEDASLGSPEPQGILKRKSNSSSSSSTASSHVSIAQAVILAAAGGAEIIEDDKDAVRPILKKKSFSEERPCPELFSTEGPRPILKKKSLTECEDYDFDRPKKPILKTSKKLSSEDGNASSFDLSEDDRSSRRPSLLKSRTSDYSGSECETTVKPILKQRCSSLTRERSQSPRPRLSFCADNECNVTNFSAGSNDTVLASPLRTQNIISTPPGNTEDENHSNYPSAVLRRRNLRPKSSSRSKSLVCEVNEELLSILNNRRLKVDETCENSPRSKFNERIDGVVELPKAFPSIASRIKSMEKYLSKEGIENSTITQEKSKHRDRDRFKTQPITLEEIQSVSSSLEPGQTNFQPLGPVGVGSFPSRFASEASAPTDKALSSIGNSFLFLEDNKYSVDSSRCGVDSYISSCNDPSASVSGFYESFPDKFETFSSGFGQSATDSKVEGFFIRSADTGPNNRRSLQEEFEKVQQEVDRVLVALDEDTRALEEEERQQAEADNWSLNVSCDSGVYNRASSRDSNPHSGEELGLIEAQDHKGNSSNSPETNDWPLSVQDLDSPKMEQQQERDGSNEGEAETENCRFLPGLVKSNSVVARASMWQQLQQQAKGVPRPLIRHSRSKTKDLGSVLDRFSSQTTSEASQASAEAESVSLSPSKSGANLSLDRDDEAKLDEDDPAKMTLMEKMKMFNTRLNYKPPTAARIARKEDRTPRSKRLKTMPVLASQVPEPISPEERLSQSFTNEDIPRDYDFQRKMELFRSASLRNTSLEYVMQQNEKNKRLDGASDAETPCVRQRAERMITPEVRGILKTGATTVPKEKPLIKGESSEGLKDEGIDSSSDESASASSVSSSEKSCSSSTSSSDELPDPKPKRTPPKYLNKHNKLKASRTDSDLAKVLKDPYPTKIKLPCLNEMKDRLNRVQHDKEKEDLSNFKAPEKKEKENVEDEAFKNRFLNKKRFVKKPDEPLQLGKLRRPSEKVVQSTQSLDEPPPKIAESVEAKKRLSGHFDERKPGRTIEELTAAVKKYIPQVSKSASLHALNARLVEELRGRREDGSGSDGESSGGREVRYINTRRSKYRSGGVGAGAGGAVCAGVQRSATHSDMPHRGGTIAERLAALQAAGANDWRSRVCRLSPEQDDTKAIERAKNRINDSLNQEVDENKKIQIEENELKANILADRRKELESSAQGWRKRVPQTDASLFSVAGRLERDKPILTSTPPLTPVPSSPGVPTPNKFRSRKQLSPTNGFLSGPLRSASCAAVGALQATEPAAVKICPRPHDSFKRSHSVTENISRVDDELSPPVVTGPSVSVPRADDETFTAFYTSASQTVVASELLLINNNNLPDTVRIEDVDLDAIDSTSRQLLGNGARRARLNNRRAAASRNPLRALAARTDLRAEYTQPPTTGVVEKEQKRLNMEKVSNNAGLAAEALAALAAREDFSNVALRSCGAAQPASGLAPHRPLMLLQVKGRRRVQTRLVEPIYTNVNRGDCFVLVTPDQVFHYIGYYSNVIERSRGSDVALHVHNTKDLGCKNSTSVIIIDEQTKNFTNKHWHQFWSLLGAPVDSSEFKPIEAGHPDEDEIYESTIIQTNMCYELMDDELVPIKEFWGQVPKISMLSPSKVIVLDFGSEMYIWNGKNVSLDKRRLAAQLAQELFDEGYNYEDCYVNPLSAAEYQGTREQPASLTKTSKSRPEWAILAKVTQHMETILFREKFLDWPDFTRVIKVKHQENKTSNSEITPCDPEEMLANEYEEPDLVLEGSHIGRGTNYYDKETMRNYDIKTKSVSKWVVQEYDYQKIENETEIPEFYSGDSYIIRWEYQITVTGRELNGKPSKHNLTGRDRCAYFCWQGKDASSNEKGTAALLTVELDREKGPQVRVTQGNEPPAFLNLFQGNLIIHQGKRDVDKSRYRLYITRGNIANEAYLLQVPCSMRQLRSRGSLLLVDTEKGGLNIWHGVRSLKHTKQVAIELANKLIARKSKCLFGSIIGDVQITEIKEGDEPKTVLDALGGANRQFYNSLLNKEKEPGEEVTPRLFHFTDLGGQFEANEVLSPLRQAELVTPFPFEQKELYSASQPALFMLDDGKSVWLWQGWWPNTDGDIEPAERNAGVGAFAQRWQSLRAAALATCTGYWRASKRGPAVDVRVVAAGLEPLTFSNLFDTWQDRDDVAELNIAYGYKAGETLSGVCELSRLNSSSDVVLPLAALQQRPLPEDVHPQHLERHLSTPDFQEAFGMGRSEFSDLPAWKQTNLKKDLGLF